MTRIKLTEENYFSEIARQTYIQEWFGGTGGTVSQDCVVDCIIESYPLCDGVNRADVAEWVKDEVAAYNDDIDDCHKLPLT